MSDELWQRFTGPATRVVQYAQQEALKLGGNVVSTEHILLGLLREKDSIAARVLEYLGVSFEKVRAELERSGLVRKPPTKEAPTSWSPKAKRVLELALEEAGELNPRLGLPNYIDTEHLLLGLIREGEGQAARVLRALDVDFDRVRAEVVTQLGGTGAAPAASAGRDASEKGATRASDELWQRFTGPATRVVQYSQEEARKLGADVVSSEHVLLGLLREGDGIAARVLERLGISLGRVRAEVQRRVGVIDNRVRMEAPTQWSPKAKRVLEVTLEEARTVNPLVGLPIYVDTEHILLGLIREEENQAVQILRALNVDFDRVRAEVVAQLGGVHEAALRRTPQPRPAAKPPHTGGQPVYELMVETEFSAAHSLEGYEGACAQLHGHNYRVIIELAGNELDHRGMLLDFREVKRIVESFVSELDHQHLNKLEAFEAQNPTSENLARHIFHHVAGAIGELEGLGERKIWPVKVTVYESSRSAASYGEPFAQ